MNVLSRQQYIEVCHLLRISAYWDEVAEYDDNRSHSDGELFVEMAMKIREFSNEAQ